MSHEVSDVLFQHWLKDLVARSLGYEPEAVQTIRMTDHKAVVVHEHEGNPVITHHMTRLQEEA